VHNQVVQAVLRFGRDESVHENGGATVYISTYALPSWFDVTNELEVSTIGEKEEAIIEQLYEAFATDDEDTFSYQSAKSLMKRAETTNLEDSVSERQLFIPHSVSSVKIILQNVGKTMEQVVLINTSGILRHI